VNRTIMIHTVDGPIFCIGEELFRAILERAANTVDRQDRIMGEMIAKCERHLDQSPA